MGACTQTIATGDAWTTYGNRRGVFGTLALSSSYATNGDTVTAAKWGLGRIDAMDFQDMPPGYTLYFDKTNLKVKAYRAGGFTPAGTNATSAVTGTAAAQTFTGSALAAHTHALHFQTTAAANAVTAAADQLRTGAAAFDVVGVTTNTGEGGVVQVTGGTPAGTNATSALTEGVAVAQVFAGTAVAATALVEVANAVDLSAVSANTLTIGA